MSTEETIYNQMISLLEEIQPDVEKFYDKGNKAAGTRVRKAMQEIKSLAQDQRLEISEMNKK
jgi:hypothetical protein